jgi:hypothetical protein
MSLHLITNNSKNHSMHSLLFGVTFFGAGAVGIFTGLMMSVCEEVPSPSNIASLLQIKNIEIY